MARADMYEVRVAVDGQSMGIFDTRNGGAVTAESTSYKPGGMGGTVQLGGSKSTEDLEIARLEARERQDHALVTWLMQRVGSARVVCTETPLTKDAQAAGPARTYRGVLTGVTPSDHDSEDNTASRFTITVAVEGTPS